MPAIRNPLPKEFRDGSGDYIEIGRETVSEVMDMSDFDFKPPFGDFFGYEKRIVKDLLLAGF